MIVIIGAGPVGCFLGGLLAKEGKEVAVYEEHKVIGRPLQCTGIVTEELGKIVKLKRKFVVNRLNKVKINSLHNSAELKLGKEIVLDRVRFDQYLAKKALDNGAGIFLEHKYLGYRDGRVVLADKKNRFIKIKADKIIGADGPLSDIAKSNGFFGKRDFLIGMQARVKGNFQNYYEVNFGICKDFFGWVVPENRNISRMGIGSRKNAGKFFENFSE